MHYEIEDTSIANQSETKQTVNHKHELVNDKIKKKFLLEFLS